MKITPASDAPPGLMDPTHFEGQPIRRDYGAFEAPEGTALLVRFPAGARTHWHSHPGGQLLYVIDGEGRVGTRDGQVARIGVGGLVHASPDEEHWHGATETQHLEHLALNFGTTEWLEPVTDR